MGGMRRRVIALVAAAALVGAATGMLGSAWSGQAADAPLPRGTIYVANLRTPEVVALDLPSGAVAGRVPLPNGAHELARVRGGALYATVYRAAALARIDPSGGLIDTAPRPHGITALPDGTLLLTLGEDDAIAAYRADGAELWRVAVGREPHAVALGPNGRAYVASADDGSVSVVDIDRHKEVARYAAGATPESISAGSDGTIYVANADSGSISIVDDATGAVREVPVGGRPVRVVAMPDGGALAAVAVVGRLVALDRGGVRWAVDIGPAPDGIALDPSGRWAFVAENRSGTIAAVDLGTRAVRARFHIEGGPSALWFEPRPAAN